VERTNIARYAQRQAQSCAYLEHLFADIAARAGDFAPHLAPLFARLVAVHQRQYHDLAQHVTIPATEQQRSFYFEHLYAAMGLSALTLPDHLSRDDLLAILAIQGVSYLRGQDRYDLLRTYQAAANQPFIPVWQQFYQDATTNASRVFTFIGDHFPASQVEPLVNAVLATEDLLMRDIWRYNQVSSPPM
jgi:hypothetical protein